MGLLVSARQRLWANARILAPGTLVFASLILLTTFIHLDRFHWHGPTTYAQFQAWLWITIYALYPLVLLAGWIHPHRQPGGDPNLRLPLPPWLRVVLASQAALFLAVGAALLVAPAATSDAIWPWELTPLTGRAIAAWLIALGIVAANALYENDWERIPVAPSTYTAVGVLQLVVVARYTDDFDWSDVQSWAYVVFFAFVAAVGAIALYLAARARTAG